MVDEKPKQGEASRFMKLGLAGALGVAMVWTGASPAVAQPEKADIRPRRQRKLPRLIHCPISECLTNALLVPCLH